MLLLALDVRHFTYGVGFMDDTAGQLISLLLFFPMPGSSLSSPEGGGTNDLLLFLALPVTLSSMLSSLVGVLRCSLLDTRSY